MQQRRNWNDFGNSEEVEVKAEVEAEVEAEVKLVPKMMIRREPLLLSEYPWAIAELEFELMEIEKSAFSDRRSMNRIEIRAEIEAVAEPDIKNEWKVKIKAAELLIDDHRYQMLAEKLTAVDDNKRFIEIELECLRLEVRLMLAVKQESIGKMQMC